MKTADLPAFDMVVFGATGDLAMRKLIPALYYRCRDGQLPAEGRIIGASRREFDREGFVASVREAAARFIPEEDREPDAWARFETRLNYLTVDATQPDDYEALATLLNDAPDRVRVFYLATGSAIFGPVCEHLKAAGLITAQTRVVLEKPLGEDLESARALNERVCSILDEEQVYRIDHYLGKEPVQNLMVLRFGNILFESLWHRKYIDHIQISVAETVGVEGRVEFYDSTGAMRDMVQSHLLQLLCIIAMEPPSSLDPDAVRDEKLKVLRSMRPITGRDVDTMVVRGQYREGAVDGKAVPGYRDEERVSSTSSTETFVAMKVMIDSWRWAQVPFYLRTGKRLARRTSEILVQFRDVPYSLFDADGRGLQPNQLVIRLQPKEGIRLRVSGKRLGTGMAVRPLELNLDQNQRHSVHIPNAYERLLVDAIAGRATLFVRRDEMEAAWRWIQPILDHWRDADDDPYPYVASTTGPNAAAALLAKDQRAWDEEVDQ
ncbi:MAG: glucose-6-phosphate dehydrogenase [Pseudomonadota bacterium]